MRHIPDIFHYIFQNSLKLEEKKIEKQRGKEGNEIVHKLNYNLRIV